MAIHNAIVQAQKHMVWKMRNANANEFQINARLKNTDWSKTIDRDAILKRSNCEKNYQLWVAENRNREKELEYNRLKELEGKCTAKYFFKLMQKECLSKTGSNLIVNEQTTPLITALCFFFSNDPRLETELGYDFKKGLILRGTCGLGKTFLVSLIKKNELKPVYIESMNSISDSVKSEGNYQPPIGGIFYIDDVGSEQSEVNHYGTKINWFQSFIEDYYLKKRPFNRLIFSTNNSFDQLEQKYGFRVRSRFREMFNVIDVSGKDMR